MDETQQRRIQEILNNGYEFDLGEFLSLGFDLFKKNIGGHVAFTVVFFFITLITAVIPVVGGFALLLLYPALSVGWFVAAHKDHKGEPQEFRNFFKGFDHLGSLAFMFLIMVVAYITVLLPFMKFFVENIENNIDLIATELNFFEGIPTWVYLVFIPFVYLAVSWRWAPMLIVFYKMKPWQALETSRMLIGRKFWMFLLFFVITGLIAQMGQVVFLVGLVLTYPIGMCMEYAAFASVTGLMQEETDIVDHLID